MKYKNGLKVDLSASKQNLKFAQSFTGLALPLGTIIQHWIFRIAFAEDIKITYYSQPTPLTNNHNTDEVIGNAVFNLSGNEVLADLTITDEKMLSNVEAGNLSGLSVGITVNAYETMQDENGEEYDLFTDITINELAVCPVPAFQNARIDGVASKAGDVVEVPQDTPPDAEPNEPTDNIDDEELSNSESEEENTTQNDNEEDADVKKEEEELKQLQKQLKLQQIHQQKQDLQVQLSHQIVKNNLKTLNKENKDMQKFNKFLLDIENLGRAKYEFALGSPVVNSPSNSDSFQEALPIRKPFIMEFLPNQKTDYDQFTIHRLTYQKAADVVPEGGAKPKAGADWEESLYKLKKIAVAITVTEELLENRDNLIAKIENELIRDLYNRVDRYFLLTETFDSNIGAKGLLGTLPNIKYDADMLTIPQAKNTLDDAGYIANEIGINASTYATLINNLMPVSENITNSYFDGNIRNNVYGLGVVEAPVLSQIGTAKAPVIVADRQRLGKFVTFGNVKLKYGFDDGDFIANRNTIIAEIRCGVLLDDLQAGIVVGDLVNIAPMMGKTPITGFTTFKKSLDLTPFQGENMNLKQLDEAIANSVANFDNKASGALLNIENAFDKFLKDKGIYELASKIDGFIANSVKLFEAILDPKLSNLENAFDKFLKDKGIYELASKIDASIASSVANFENSANKVLDKVENAVEPLANKINQATDYQEQDKANINGFNQQKAVAEAIGENEEAYHGVNGWKKDEAEQDEAENEVESPVEKASRKTTKK